MKHKTLAAIFLLFIGTFSTSAQLIFIEAESFENRGGWVIDQQSMDQMGSPYMMAHGLGVPVENARTQIEVAEKGKYRVWVRTRNWVAPWGVSEAPGKFQLLFDSVPLKTLFGTEGAEWHWQDGGTIKLDKGNIEIELHDLTGFNGRCDAIILTKKMGFIPPEETDALADFRDTYLNLPEQPELAGEFDLVVVGGGIAGITSAISAARLGCKVALIQNRPVLGGNNSSEVRVGLSGLIFQEPYPNLGKLVDEIGSVGHWTFWEVKLDPESERSKKNLEIIENNPEKKIHNAGPQSNYGDDKKQKIVEAEENIELFLNTHVFDAEKSGDKIISVTGRDIITGKELIFKGQLFADCTGDGNLGFLAGADFRMGMEDHAETEEPSAPEKDDDLVMGTSVQWYAEKPDKPSSFPECTWAVHFTEETAQHLTRGDWDWETGFYWDQIEDIEYIRDYALRAVFGNWSYLKNKSKEKEKYNEYQLKWVAYIGGKRESRRLLGDVILKEQDLLTRVEYPDASFTTTWTIDLHYPVALKGFNEEPFLSKAKHIKIEPYAVPYRCLYSRNINNLFMAGRNISVTHVALGTVRVMRTTGMMGEVVGMAASLAKKYGTNPRGVYQNHLDDLKLLMEKGVGRNWYE
ncbi:FAD dependent oxidoreductase [Mariniphaga anaerophila]|uniref:FAD dependent oxidoreductase n=1 Tax=Mariniphaga anaerophila TaxID=1484053 RepID=A0A1M5A7A0_9BACT|nr:FAD-dependent oxidoreductase [Mariniphaga anaerophila]SHF26183.1 FAD dependent oxidoreductase [Mariniphaga anaerophila]